MEFILIAALLLVLVVGGVAYVRRRPGRDHDLEPPAPSTGLERRGTTRVDDDDLVAEVEEALGGVHDESARGGVLAPEPEAPAPPPTRPRFRDRLTKARGTIGGYLSSIRSRKVDAATWDELEEALIRADVGVAVTGQVLDALKATATEESITDPDLLLDRLKVQLKDLLAPG